MIIITHLNCFEAIRQGWVDWLVGPDEMVVWFQSDYD